MGEIQQNFKEFEYKYVLLLTKVSMYFECFEGVGRGWN